MRSLLPPLLMLLAPIPALGQPVEPEPSEAPADDPAGDDALIEGPRILEYVEAPYPEAARAEGLEATVRLLIELDEEGDVVRVEVIEPVGHGFDEAAVDAVLEMTFAPARAAEGPVPVVFEFAYGFVLEPEEPEEAAPAPVNVEGTLREMGTRRPIEGASIVVDGTDLVAVTDADGAFSLRGVPLGTVTLRTLHPGHVTDELAVEVVEGEVTVVPLWMRSEAYRDNELVGTYQRVEDEVTRRTLTMDEVRRIPGTFGDPVKVIQTLPGAARTPFGTGLLVIRGSNPEDSGVYIDGVRIPIIYHLTGTTSVLSPDLIESVDYLPGGYGVQYGRSTGGVVDVKTRTQFDEQGKLVWGTDILDSQLYYEGRLGKNKKHGLAIGARRSYIDVFIPIFTGDTGFALKPRYWDYQLKWVPQLEGKRELSAFVYGFDDLLRVETPDDFAQGSDQDTQGNLRTQYNSHRAILRYRHELSDQLVFDFTPSLGVDGAFFGLGQEFSLDNTNWLVVTRADLSWKPVPAIELVSGLDLFGGLWRFDFRSAIRISDLDDPLAEREPMGFDGQGSAWSPDLFVKANLRPIGGTDRWLLTPGLRLNTVASRQAGGISGGDGEPLPWVVTQSVDPRLLTRVQVIPDKLSLKGATGLYHQPAQPQEMVGVGTTSDVQHERSWSSSVGFEHRLTESIRYDVDVFYKRMGDLILYDNAWSGFGSNPFLNGGDGRAYGLEVIARHDRTGRFFGWISYTLSRASRRDTPYCAAPGDDLLGRGDCWYRFDFDQTHILSAQAGYDLPKDFGVSLQVQYVTGNPASNYDAGIYDVDGNFYNGFRLGGYNADRLPPFFQTSLRVDRLWTFRTWQLNTYVDLLNAVRGVNPEFLLYNYDYSESAYIRGLPFIPNIGVEAKFHL